MTARLDAAKAANKKALDAITGHDRRCRECDVRRRHRCEAGQRLVEAFWATSLEQAAAVREARAPAGAQMTLDDLFAETPEGD